MLSIAIALLAGFVLGILFACACMPGGLRSNLRKLTTNLGGPDGGGGGGPP